MTSTISTSYANMAVMGYLNGTSNKSKVTTCSATDEEQEVNASKRVSKENSIVTEYRQRYPDRAKYADKYTKAGRQVMEAWGASEIDTTKMTMAEYKQHIAGILDSIPFDASRMYDEESIYITEEGWEQMKNDPEYEAWVVGYVKVNRSVHNPFAAMGFGAGSSYSTLHFGAKIEEFNGYSFSKTYGGTAAGARSLFESKTQSGAMIKRAPQADAYPPKDYDIKQQQEKARKKRKKQQEEWDAMFFKRKETELIFAKKAQARELFEATHNTLSPDMQSMAASASVSPAAASMAYESATMAVD